MIVDNPFLVTASIVYHVDHAMQACKRLSITASNARALAIQAGDAAAGFRPLTDYINRFAIITKSSSHRINQLACDLSHIATEKDISDRAINHIKHVYSSAQDATYIHSLDPVKARAEQRQQDLQHSYEEQLRELSSELNSLSDELRSADIVVTMSRIEALQAKGPHQNALNNVADNVEKVTASVKKLIDDAKRLVNRLKK